MELNSIIALGIFGTIFSVIFYRFGLRYISFEKEKVASEQKAFYERKILDLEGALQSVTNSMRGYKSKYNKIRNEYDVDFDEEDIPLDQEDSESIIPTVAEAIFGKLPPKIKEVLGKDEVQDTLLKVAEKNADKIPNWIEKFVQPKLESPGSETPTPKLKEAYL